MSKGCLVTPSLINCIHIQTIYQFHGKDKEIRFGKFNINLFVRPELCIRRKRRRKLLLFSNSLLYTKLESASNIFPFNIYFHNTILAMIAVSFSKECRKNVLKKGRFLPLQRCYRKFHTILLSVSKVGFLRFPSSLLTNNCGQYSAIILGIYLLDSRGREK